MQNTHSHLDALIVGAGPTGLTLAIELTRRGLRCRVIDQLAEPVTYSKAQVVHARTLELLHRGGLAARLLSRGIQIHGLSIYNKDLKRLIHATFEPMASRYEYILSVSQHDTEIVLTEGLSELGVSVERGVKLERFEQDGIGVAVTMALPGGERQTVRAAYLIGCDGAHSAVRKGLSLPFEGVTYEERIIQADVRIDWSFNHSHDELMSFVADTGLLGVFPLPGEQRYRLLTFVNPHEPMEPVLSTFQRLMDERGPKGARVSDPAWMVDFRIHRRMVPEYRVGRVFLAGDAAHIHSPAGGQGMNTGVQDAMNLAWKLALVHRGEGRPELLDSYTAERHPVAAATLRSTDAAITTFSRMISLRHPIAVALREKVLEFVGMSGLFSRVGRMASMLDIAYPDSPIVGQDRGSPLTLPGSRDAEPPGLRDFIDFGSGPAPGSRPPDVVLGDGEPAPRLFDALEHQGHTLLLFDGAIHSEAGYQNLAGIARAVTDRYGDLVTTKIVIPLRQRPDALPADAPVLMDPEGAAHQAYGARGECLYLIRPDGYVAYRCQPARLELVNEYLSRVFV